MATTSGVSLYTPKPSCYAAFPYRHLRARRLALIENLPHVLRAALPRPGCLSKILPLGNTSASLNAPSGRWPTIQLALPVILPAARTETKRGHFAQVT